MATRTLGSQLVAKNSPGGKLRETTETRIATPEIPGKGVPGTLSRAGIEEPLVRAVPPGSEKIVSQQPTIEGTTVAPLSAIPEAVSPVAPIAGQAPLAPTVPQGGQNQALFQGGVGSGGGGVSTPAPSSASRPSGASASVVSQQGGTAPRVGGGQVQGAQTAVQAPQAALQRESLAASTVGRLAGKAYADAGDAVNKVVSYVPTAGQFLAGGVGKALTSIGSAIKAPQLAPGGLGAQLQSFGGQPTKNTKGQNVPQAGSISATVGRLASSLKNAASNLFGRLTGKK